MIPFLVSLTGFLFGLSLAFIAPEELKSGEKYFLLFKEALFCFIIVFSSFSFVVSRNYYLCIIILSYLALYFLLIRRRSFFLAEIFNYSFFAALYLIFLFSPAPYLILLPSLVFLYGLPSGTLVRLMMLYRQEAKYYPHNKIK